MKLLAIDTSTTQGSVSIMQDNGDILTRFSTEKENYSTRLFRWLEELRLESEIGEDFQSLDGIVVTSGPGTFTGLRVGIATAKAFSISAQCPLLHFPTLETMAAMKKDEQRTLCPMVLAGRGEVYTATFKDGKLVKPHQAIKPSELFSAPAEEDLLIFGNGTELIDPELINLLGSEADIEREPQPLSPQLCLMARDQLENNPEDIQQLEITYIRSAVS